MRKLLIVLALIVLCAAGWAWPYVGAYGLAKAAEEHDVSAVAARVDFPELRRSLAREVIHAYLRDSGRGQKMGGLQRSLAVGIGTTVADPYLSELLSPDTLASLLGDGHLKPLNVQGRLIAFDQPLPRLPDLLGSKLIAVFIRSYFDGPTSFVFNIPADRETEGQYGVHLRLTGTTWRLSGIDLPETLLERIVADIIAKEKADRQS